MPELPDILAYITALESRVVGRKLERIRIASPFILRTVSPKASELEGNRVLGLRRMGKRIVMDMEDELFIVIHLMIAGRLKWREKGAKVAGKIGLAAFDFENGTLLYTEASTKKRAALYFERGEASLRAHERGGLEVLGAELGAFRSSLIGENHT